MWSSLFSSSRLLLFLISDMIIYGKHAALAALANPMRKIKRVLVTKNTRDELTASAGDKLLSGIKNLQIVDGKKLDDLLPKEAVHQGIAVECETLLQPSLQEFLSSPASNSGLVMLDQVSDPHNVGAILRSAAAFNAGAVIVTDRNAPSESGVMAKAASGALEIVPLITIGNLSQAIELLKKSGYWVYGLDGEAKQLISAAKFDRKTVLVLGAEGRGLRRLTSERCDSLVRLPISDKMESLNVSNAAAISLYELNRQIT
ncbi:MAG: 23S rRNA (guanosine(2251)-2'-O)-methyltransferase RlmB [Rickettsiales bacterium]